MTAKKLPPKREKKPVVVRLDDESRRRLDQAAKALAINRTALIRMAVHQLLPQIESGRLQKNLQ